jgi:hypothetical protein
VKSDLERVPLPDEKGAAARAWRVLSAAHASREPVRRPRRRPLVAAVALVASALVAGALATSPGQAVLDEIREVVGVERAQPALFSLPADGRLLVTSEAGAWVVQADGSKRLLGDYREASWSPFGRYVVAARDNELAALEPDGDVRWTLARRGVRSPRWAGTATDTRIAYRDRTGIRVVAGDGTGDRLLAPAAGVPFAWRPGARHELAYVVASEVRVQDADSGRVLWRANRGLNERVSAVAWSTDGARLLVLARRALRVYDAAGHLVERNDPPDGWPNVAAIFVPGSHDVAIARVHGSQSTLFLLRGGDLFNTMGAFRDVAAAPDGRWLLVGWPAADQWVFVRSDGRRIRAVSDVSAQFRGRSFPRVEGWCCAE